MGDLLGDDKYWIVCVGQVDTKTWLQEKRILLQIMRIDYIVWAERSVAVILQQHATKPPPAYDPSQLITPAYEIQLFKHYGTEAA